MTCEDVYAAVYGFPPFADSAAMYALGFGLVIFPGLLMWAGARVVAAIRSMSNL